MGFSRHRHVAGGVPTAEEEHFARNRMTQDNSEVPLGRGALDVASAWSTIGIFTILGFTCIHYMSLLLIPVTMAVVVGMILGMAAGKLNAYGIPGLAVAFILSGLVAIILFFIGNALIEPITFLAREGPHFIEKTVDRILPSLERMQWIRISPESLRAGPLSIESVLDKGGSVVSIISSSLTPAIIQGLIFFAALLLFLYSRLHLRRGIIMAFPQRHQRLRAVRIIVTIEEVLGSYFSTAALMYCGLGLVMVAIAWLGNLPMPLLWGLFAFLSSFIPFIGITLMTIAIAIAGMMVHDGIFFALAPSAAFFIVHLLMENLAFPAVMGRNLEINPFIVFIAIIFWTWMWGAAGAMLALPLSLIMMTVVSELFPARRIVPNLPD